MQRLQAIVMILSSRHLRLLYICISRSTSSASLKSAISIAVNVFIRSKRCVAEMYTDIHSCLRETIVSDKMLSSRFSWSRFFTECRRRLLDLFPVLLQCTRLTDKKTDGQTDRILIAKPRLHSMQRGKTLANIYFMAAWRSSSLL